MGNQQAQADDFNYASTEETKKFKLQRPVARKFGSEYSFEAPSIPSHVGWVKLFFWRQDRVQFFDSTADDN